MFKWAGPSAPTRTGTSSGISVDCRVPRRRLSTQVNGICERDGERVLTCTLLRHACRATRETANAPETSAQVLQSPDVRCPHEEFAKHLTRRDVVTLWIRRALVN